MKKNNYILYMIIIVLIFIIYKSNSSKNNEINNEILLNDSISGVLEQYKNKYNEEVTKVETITSTNNKLIADNKSVTNTANNLKKEIKKYQKENSELVSTVRFTNTLLAEYQDSIENIIIGNTSVIDSSGVKYVYPTYNKEINMFNNWITGNISLGLNKTNINILVDNEYTSTIYKERKNLFSKYDYYTVITNHNPYTKTKLVKSYSKLPVEEKRWQIIGFVGIVYTTKFIIAPGIGIGYTFIKF